MSELIKVDYRQIEVYTQAAVDDFSCPLILSIPHSGRFFPKEFFALTNLSENDLRANEDIFVDEILEPLIKEGVPTLKMNVARAFVDVNRDKIELDDKMFYDYPADKIIFDFVKRVAYALFGVIGTVADALSAINAPLRINHRAAVTNSYGFRGAMFHTSCASRTFFGIKRNRVDVCIHLKTHL